MATTRRWLLGALLCLANSAAASAQVPTPKTGANPSVGTGLSRVYVQAGVVASVHPLGPGYLRVDSAVHGTSLAGVAGVGVRFGPTLALEAETSVERAVATRLTYAYALQTSQFDAALRDLLLGTYLRWNPGPKYHIEFTIGGGLAVSTYDGLETATYRQGMAGGGISVPVQVGAFVVSPTASYRWVNRPGMFDAAHLGASPHTFHVGLVVRP